MIKEIEFNHTLWRCEDCGMFTTDDCCFSLLRIETRTQTRYYDTETHRFVSRIAYYMYKAGKQVRERKAKQAKKKVNMKEVREEARKLRIMQEEAKQDKELEERFWDKFASIKAELYPSPFETGYTIKASTKNILDFIRQEKQLSFEEGKHDKRRI